MASDASVHAGGEAARAGVPALLDFLEAYYRLARPPLRDISGYGEFLLRQSAVPDVPGVVLSPAAEHWLTVTLVAHADAPEVPLELRRWLTAESLSPHVRPAIDLTDDADEDEFTAALLLEEWADEAWQPWAEQWQRIESARAFYKDLYSLRTRLERDRDGFELMWGFGRLRWSSAVGAVDHPLVTTSVEIDLNDAGQLSIAPVRLAEIEAAFLAELDLADRAEYLSLRRHSAAADLDLWHDESRSGLFGRLLRSISHDGTHSSTVTSGSSPLLTDEWVLYLRRRQGDYVGFLEQQRELYRSGALPSQPFLSLVLDNPSDLASGPMLGSASAPPREQAGALYLPKAANQEQHRILRLAQERAGVTAQGPPGTGKSHTIANLICHFVAEGKRVLVTAEKEQALAVLAEKLPTAVRELSVTVGGGDQASYTRLEHAVTAIQTRVSTFEASETEADIDRAQRALDETDAAIAHTSNRLRSTRRVEAETLTGEYLAGLNPSPSDIAGWLASNSEGLALVPDELDLEAALPLSGSEWSRFVQLTAALSTQDVEACQRHRPGEGQFPSGASLARQVEELGELRRTLVDLDGQVVSWDRLAASSDKLDGLRDEVVDATDWLVKISGSWLDRVRQESADDLGRREWEEFAAGVAVARQQAVEQRMETAAHVVDVPTDPAPDLLQGLWEARERFSSGNRVSRVLHRQAAKALDACQVDGRIPSTAAHVELCAAAVIRIEQQRELASRWRNLIARVGGPELGLDRPVEDAVSEHLGEIRRAIDWGRVTWPALQAKVRGVGIRGSAGPTVEDVRALVSTLELARMKRRERQLANSLGKVSNALQEPRARDASPLWERLAASFASRRWNDWDEALAEVARLGALEEDAYVLGDLTKRLQAVAPLFTAQLVESRADRAPEYGQLVQAWEWRQLEGWLATRTGGPSPSELQRELENLASRRLQQMEQLVAARSWRGLAVAFDDRNRASLNKYLTAVKKFGKTGGKYADRWRREIREALDESKDAIPVWIMPTSRVLESFRPTAEPPFDVLIIDEASQIGLLGLPILSLAKKAIVVGDDQQTSPENVGLDRQAVFDLIDAHLGGVQDSRTLFDADNSLYDAARQKFPEVVVLTEHFRCLPQIISFSNGRYYGGRMVPLRDRPPTPTWNPVGTVFVPDGFRAGEVNEPEALATVDLIAELTMDVRYEEMTFGVIALLGRSQSLRVMELLLDRLGPEILESRQIRCGEAADFQGDERDVIIISTVVDHPEGRRIGPFTDRKSERRLNVAASRAKNQLWVVHSLEPEDFPNGDPRAELIRHCQNPNTVEVAYSNLEERCDSPFEKAVLRAILERGYRRVRAQQEVGRYRIDLVVEGPTSRLAVECDGDRWHGLERWDADRSRQQILERAGWTFERIRGSSFYRDPQVALEPLWERLERLGIPTGDWGAADGPELAVRRTAPTMAERQAAAHVLATVRTGVPVAELSAEPASPKAPDEIEAPPVRATDTSLPSPADMAERIRQLTSSAGVPAGKHQESSGDGPRGPAPSPSTTSLTAPRLTDGRVGDLLAPHREWPRRRLLPVLDSPPDQVIDELVEIVSVEGPMLALRLYQVHTKAAGGARVGREMKQTYNKLVTRAVRDGRLAQIGDTIPGQVEKTLHSPGGQPVVVRELGPRPLHEVPRSEIRTLADRLGVESGEGAAAKRTVLGTYGLKKLTQKTDAYLDACFTYAWNDGELP